MNIRPPVDKQRGNSGLITVDRTPQRRLAKTVSCLDAGSAIEQSACDLHVASSSRHVKGTALFGAIMGIHVGSALHQGADHISRSLNRTFIGKGV